MQILDFTLKELVPGRLPFLDIGIILGDIQLLGDVLHLVGGLLLDSFGVGDVHVADEVVDAPVGEQLVDNLAVGLFLFSFSLVGLGTSTINDVVRVNLQRVELHGHHYLVAHGVPLYVAFTLEVVLAADLLDFVNGQLILSDAYGLAFQLAIACCSGCRIRYLYLVGALEVGLGQVFGNGEVDDVFLSFEIAYGLFIRTFGIDA